MKAEIIYIAIACTLTLVLLLIFYTIKRYFDFQEKNIGSKSKVILYIVSSLMLILSIQSGISDVVINGIIEYLQTNHSILLGYKLDKSTELNRLSILVSIGLLIFLFYFVKKSFGNNKNLIFWNKNEKKQHKIPDPKIEFPKNDYVKNPVFHERIKKIFELKFQHEKIKFKYDKEFKILYSKHKQGLHTYAKVVFCKESILGNAIANNELNQIIRSTNNAIRDKLKFDDVDILDKYIITESGGFSSTSKEYICITEDELVYKLIDFDDYLKTLIHKYYNDILPFTTIDEKSKPTLS